jgi:hypothetical protein
MFCRIPGDFPFFVLFIDKGNIKASIPKAILPQATLCYPIRQSQLYQVIMDVSLERGERENEKKKKKSFE